MQQLSYLTFKKKVAINFSQAANTYDGAAKLQQRIAQSLFTKIPKHFSPANIIDMGCGTGQHTALLNKKYHTAYTLGIDIAPGMIHFAKQQYPNLNFCIGDVENLSILSNSIDLIFSSLCIQWCNLQQALQETFRILRPKGYFIFTTLAENSLLQLKQAWQHIDPHHHVNIFPNSIIQESIINQSSFTCKELLVMKEYLYFDNLLDLLNNLKELGVNTISQQQHTGLLTKNKIIQLKHAYEKHRQSNYKLPLSYEIIYAILQKP